MLASVILSAALAATVPVPAGISIPATMVSSVSSKTAKVGDTFTFRTTKNVRAGALFVPANTPGEGVVSAVSHAAGTRRGTLTLTPQRITLASGQILTVAAAGGGAYAARRHVFALPIPLPGVLLIGGVENPGRDVTIGPGTDFTVVTTAARNGRAPSARTVRQARAGAAPSIRTACSSIAPAPRPSSTIVKRNGEQKRRVQNDAIQPLRSRLALKRTAARGAPCTTSRYNAEFGADGCNGAEFHGASSRVTSARAITPVNDRIP